MAELLLHIAFIDLGRGGEAGAQRMVKRGAAICFRMLSPWSTMRWALCTIRSRMASATVGSAIRSCHLATGTWAVIRVDLRR
ncbi:hypothetical protein A9K71_17125 [Mesorhizobium sp. WSM3873]|nr:hypothetical protein A9K71_17125 [Mesorhizobium sp. WSM3873]